MALFPGALIPWIEQRFLDADGAPLIGGLVYTYVAGTSTPLATYTDVDLTSGNEHPNPIELNGAARPPSPIYLQATGYKFVVKDANEVTQYTIDDIEDVGQVFAENFGTVIASGSYNVVSGYQVLTTDRLVTVDSAGGADPCLVYLPAASDATQPVCIKNFGDVALAVTADGTDTIDANVSVYTVPAAVNPMAPCIWLASDGVSSWYVIASHGI
jgi:hypothetical protein